MSSSDADTAGPALTRLDAAAQAFAEAAEEVMAGDAATDVSEETLQRVLAAGARLFARKVEAERRDFLPIAAHAVTATDAVMLMGGMLQAVNLSVFDLSMWVDGRPR